MSIWPNSGLTGARQELANIDRFADCCVRFSELVYELSKQHYPAGEIKGALLNFMIEKYPDANIEKLRDYYRLGRAEYESEKSRKNNKHILYWKTAIADQQIEYRLNTLADNIEIRQGKKGVWYKLTDNEEAYLKSRIEQNLESNWSRELWAQFTRATAHENRVNPFISDWLDKLPDWDGINRLPRIFHDCFDIGNLTDVIPYVSEMMLVAIIQRAYAKQDPDQPAVEFQFIPVLSGEYEGEGKSTFCKWILPSKYRDKWYSANFPFHAKDIELRAAIEGKIIVEAAEMEGLNRVEYARVKNVSISPYLPKVAKKYDRYRSEGTRTDIVIASTNRTDFIPHTPGRARRWVPILVENINPQKIRNYWDKNRKQIWAEALYRKDDIKLYLPKKLEKIQAEENKEFMNRDLELEQNVLNAVANMKMEFTMAELISSINDKMYGTGMIPIDNKRHTQITISTILRNHGYSKERKSVRGLKGYYWSNEESLKRVELPEKQPEELEYEDDDKPPF